MTVDEILEYFEADPYNTLRTNWTYSNRCDLNALILLDNLFKDYNLGNISGLSSGDNLIAGSDHGVIYLAPGLEDLEAVGIAQEQLQELIDCGVFFDTTIDCLCLYV